MNYDAKTPDEYFEMLPDDRKPVMKKLREVIKENLPYGFEETMGYGMVGYVVPHSIYPKGYHVAPSEPLPFIGLASQKNHIAFYHMGIYSYPEILEWFKMEYAKVVSTKLDMGKSCIRFKNMSKIPYELLGELCTKIEINQFIEIYESSLEKYK